MKNNRDLTPIFLTPIFHPVGDPSLWEPTPWAMGVAHAPKNHHAQGALPQNTTHPAKQLGSDPNLCRKAESHNE